ncbi:MAG: 6-bladed beta-propeller [Longimicrobiales bacterium]
MECDRIVGRASKERPVPTRSLFLGLVIAVLVGGMGDEAAAQARVPQRAMTIGDRPSCSRCKLEFGRRTLLVDDSSDFGVPGRARNVRLAPDGSVFALFAGDMTRVYEFSSDGKVLRRLGRRGGGPGEFRRINSIFVDGSGRLHAFDQVLGRKVVFDSRTRQVVATTPLATRGYSVIVLGEGETILSGPLSGAATAGYPYHKFGSDGTWQKSFGFDEPAFRADLELFMLRRMRPADSRRFWSAPLNEYRLELWNVSGVQERALIGRRNWFEPWTEAQPVRSTEVPPAATLVDLSTDTQGRLWVLISVPAENWRSALSDKRDVMGNRELRPGARYLDTIVEIVEPATGKLIYRERLPLAWGGFAGLGMMWRTWLDESGVPFVELATVKLKE